MLKLGVAPAGLFAGSRMCFCIECLSAICSASNVFSAMNMVCILRLCLFEGHNVAMLLDLKNCGTLSQAISVFSGPSLTSFVEVS